MSDIERRLGGESRTLRTVQALRASFPEHEFSLVIGSDLEAETGSWYGAEELRRTVPFLVVGRGGYPGTTEVNAPSVPSWPVMPAISSTEVRERLASGRSVDQLVPRDVLDYIRQRRLYGMRESP